MPYLPRPKWTMKEMFIFFKRPDMFKTIETETVFTKTEMNKKESFIFFEIQGVFRKYQEWSCIYQD